MTTDPDDIDLDGRRFTAVSNEHGQVDDDTLFTYHQRGDVITCDYAGGQIVHGRVAGTRVGATLDFRYVHLDTAGATSSGHCTSTIVVLEDGRVRLEETWDWESRDGSGTSTVEELATPAPPVATTPLNHHVGESSGHRVDLLALEQWPDRTDLRFARVAVDATATPLPRRIPPADAWTISDDTGRSYEVLDVNGRGDRDRSTGEVQLHPRIGVSVERLHVQVRLVPGHPALTTEVDLRAG